MSRSPRPFDTIISPPISTASGLNARIAATSGSLSVPYTLSCRSDKNTQRNAAPSGSFGLSISYWSVTKCFFSYSERSKSPTVTAASAADHFVSSHVPFSNWLPADFCCCPHHCHPYALQTRIISILFIIRETGVFVKTGKSVAIFSTS